MTTVFAKFIDGREFTFYRILTTEVSYIIMYNDYGKRHSFQVVKDEHQAWQLSDHLPRAIKSLALHIIMAINENESKPAV